ncbi:unnamed protein product, partial [Ectocarpus sp. 8 AP-2014]
WQLTRQSSVAYLASFLARASFVDPSLVSTAVQSLLDWAGQYLDQYADASVATPVQALGTPSSKGFETPVATRVRARPQSWHGNHPRRRANGGDGGGGGMMQAPMSAMAARSGAGGSGGVGVGSSSSSSSSKSRPADHMLFYSVCQATFYVMCFRGDELAAMEGFDSQAVIWQRLLTCPLYPLRRCLDTVRREFARLCCGLMDAYLDRDLLEHLAGISEERSQVSQTITVGSSFSCSTPRSSSSMSMSSNAMWTPSRVTKAGGLGRGSNPLDSFFPFDPYLLRRSHVYIDRMYNTWKAQDDSSRHHRSTKSSGARTPAGAGDSDSSVTSDSSDDESSSSEDDDDDRNNDDMDASSMSFRDGASGLRARSLRERNEKAAKKKKSKAKGRLAKKRNDAGESFEGASSSSEEEEDDEAHRMSRKMADTYITESMSVTPASSVAVGSLMGRSLGQAMSSSFADDGLVWGTGAGGAAGTPDDAFFHENVSPCPSPPLAEAAISGRSRPLDIGV